MAAPAAAPPAIAPAQTTSTDPSVALKGEDQHDERLPNSIQVSLDRSAVFYSRLGRRMLTGSPDKPAFPEVIITGLGMASRTAIGAAAMMERDQQATVKKVETFFFPSNRGRARRQLPKVTITMLKNPNAPIMEEPPARQNNAAEAEEESAVKGE